MRPSDLQLDLDSFEGPFDLLCTVLLRRELELADVRLAEVVVGYVQRLAQEESIDPETASEFLVLVAALMEIKVRELLAVDEAIDLEEPAAPQAEEEMLAQLLRYTTFKNASLWLGERAQRKRYWRVASRPTIRRRATYDGPVFDPAMLARGIGVLLAQPDVDVRHLVGRVASVGEMAGRLLAILAQRRSTTFEEVVDGCTRLDQAVAFVAMLELVRSGKISIEQPDAFGDIQVNHTEAREMTTFVGDSDVAPVSLAAVTEEQIA